MPPEPPSPDPEILLELVSTRMPFGKYKGELLLDLPEAYLAWFAREGFPNGRLGVLLENAFNVKTNGLVPMLRRLVPASERAR
jgi:uncharacterized protein (DUF3820 family)